MEDNQFVTISQDGYALIDSGNEEKLEQFGEYLFRRPDPQALWQKSNPEVWEKADAHFVTTAAGGNWKGVKVPESFTATIVGITFELSLSRFKHIGIFPEQIPNWLWIKKQIQEAKRPVRVLNLFGYTGGASIAALQAGAEVVHVDASKTALTAAVRNAELSGVGEKSVRWIPEDARKFVERAARRGDTFDAIIMDPPAFGHGVKKELWKIEEDLLPLIEETKKILSDKPLFYILNGYASGYSAVAYKQNLEWLKDTYGGEIEYGELLIAEEGEKRFLPAGITARWKNN